MTNCMFGSMFCVVILASKQTFLSGVQKVSFKILKHLQWFSNDGINGALI